MNHLDLLEVQLAIGKIKYYNSVHTVTKEEDFSLRRQIHLGVAKCGSWTDDPHYSRLISKKKDSKISVLLHLHQSDVCYK